MAQKTVGCRCPLAVLELVTALEYAAHEVNNEAQEEMVPRGLLQLVQGKLPEKQGPSRKFLAGLINAIPTLVDRIEQECRISMEGVEYGPGVIGRDVRGLVDEARKTMNTGSILDVELHLRSALDALHDSMPECP